jgi:CubicO group peptidase (beta-lactamase class C family)
VHNKSLEQSAAIPTSTVSSGCLQNCDSLFDSARQLNSMLGGVIFDRKGVNTTLNFDSAAYPHLRSFLATVNGRIVLERYYQGLDKDDFHHCASITKSITSALVGVALGRGQLASLDVPIVDFLPGRTSLRTKEHLRQITFRHALSMSVGLGWDEPPSDTWDQRADLFELFCSLPQTDTPGLRFTYNTFAVHMLSLALSEAVGMELGCFAEKYLFEPLAISRGQWRRDTGGNSFGGHSAHFRARDLVKFGNLILSEGRWQGAQLIPQWFAKEATSRENEGGPPECCPYGLLWWTPTDDAFFASGYGGQYVYAKRDVSLVVVITSERDRPHFENRALIERQLIPSLFRIDVGSREDAT